MMHNLTISNAGKAIGILLILTVSPLTAEAQLFRIRLHNFGRYTVPPRVYGYKLDEDSPGYYGGMRYKEYYNFGRGFGYADFPDPFPGSLDRQLLPYRYWPYAEQWPQVENFDPNSAGACIVMQVPEGAEIWVEGQRTVQTGERRTFVSPPLAPNQKYVLQVRARWPEGTGRREQIRDVVVQRGQMVNLTFPDMTDTVPSPLPTFQAVGQ